MDRRHFLGLAGALGAAGMTTRLLAAPATDARLLFVFLRGAYDAANTLVPVSSDFYYESRPTLAIARPEAGNAQAAHRLDADWGVHPALAKGLGKLLSERQVVFVPFAGVPGVSRSHFEAQEWLELGMAGKEGEQRPPTEGMLYRLAHATGGIDAVAFTDSLPSTFRGAGNIANVGLDRQPGAALPPGLHDELLRRYRGSPLEPVLREGMSLQREVTEVFDEEMLEADRGANSVSGFAREIRRVARLMRERFNLAFVDVGGWDTHAAQGGATGPLASRLEQLGAGLAAYAEDMGPDWKRTVVVVVSEFGRTFRENGNRGTDHGYGTVYWVLGGSVPGGKVAGRQVRLAGPKSLNQDRDWPVLNDYRAVLGGVFEEVYGLSAKQLATVYGKVAPADLSLVRPWA